MKAYIRKKGDVKISACTIAKNEAQNIARCINSYKDFVDEMIVVDTGSTDDTVRIAEECGATVLHFDWCDDFSAAKNFAIDATSGDWIICLDADQYFCENCSTQVRKAIENAESRGKNAILTREVNVDKTTGLLKSEAGVIRIFRAGLRYQYPIHESIYAPQGLEICVVPKTQFYYYHTGYSSDKFQEKVKRNLRMLQKEMEANPAPDRAAGLHAYMCDCYSALQDGQATRDQAKAFLKGKAETGLRLIGLEVKPYVNSICSLEAARDKDFGELDKWISMLEKAFPNHPDAFYARARYCFRRRMFKQSLSNFEQAMRLSDAYVGSECDTVSAQKDQILFACARCKQALGDAVGALDSFTDLSRHAKNNAAMMRMLDIIKLVDEPHATKFTQDFFLALDEAAKPYMLGAMAMCYMSKPATFGYAYMRDKHRTTDIDATLSGFIQAGNGDYTGASNFFYLNAVGGHNEDSAMRALLCAVLAQDKDALEHAKSVAPACQQVALGLADEPVVQKDIPQIVALVIEADRLQGDALSAKIACAAAERLGAPLAAEFAEKLEQSFAYAAALAAVKYSPMKPDTLFLRGYYTYRMGRMGEAEDRIRLAKAWGYTEPDADAMLDLIAERLRAFRADKCPDMPSEQARVAQQMEQGKFMVARASLDMLRELAEPDVQWYSMMAVSQYYLGQDEQAALTVEAGLLQFPDNAELAYNAGDIYKRMGVNERAHRYYQQALEHCKDDALCSQIRQAMETMPV